MITGVVLARNEEANIVACLQSLQPHVGELLLIDMESSDRTVELARPYVTRVLPHPLVADFDAARNMAIPEARFDWLWFLDADERVPPRTGELVRGLVRDRGGEIAAITIPFKSYFCGKWIEHCGWWPGYTMPRVLKRGRFRFSERLHGGVEFSGPAIRLPPDPDLAIEHFSYRSIEHYVEKFNRYTTAEAGYLLEQGRPTCWHAAIAAMMHDLWLYYEKHDGRLDGERGWILSWLAGQYRWFSHAKVLDSRAERVETRAESPKRTGHGDGHVPASLDAVIQLMADELAALRSPSPQLPLGIVWRSPIWDPSGYADDSRLFLKSLAHGPRDLAAREVRWSDATCVLPHADVALLKTLTRCQRPPFVAAITSCIPSCIPTLCPPDRSASLNILRATFETDRIPADWLPIIEEFDEVWVFSTHDQRTFRRSGVPPEKLRVLPGFVDTEVFRGESPARTGESRALRPEGQEATGESPEPRGERQSEGPALPEALTGRFVFLSVFDWQLRKGWDVLLKAYSEEFSPEERIGLLLKITTSHGHSLETVRRQADEVLAALGQSLDQRPDIVIWEPPLGKLEMAALYRSVDAFVLASRGEGWGRPYMEAMSAGLPVIGTQGSGNDDFMHEGNSFLVSTRRVDVPEAAAAEIPVYRDHRWLEPDLAELRAVLRRVAAEPEASQTVARQAASDVRAKYSADRAREAVEEHLRAAETRFRTPDLAKPTDSQIRVELEGEFFAGHSFSNINEQLSLQWLADPRLALSLRRVEHNPTHDRAAFDAYRLRPYLGRELPGGPQVTIRHAFPPNWAPPERGRWVHIQPWEYGALPLDWVPPLRDRVDEIWAPSNYVKRVYEHSGIPAEKIHVIPWGVNPAAFCPDAPPLLIPTDRRFRFLFVGGTIHRKGFDLLLDAYLAEFSTADDVCLVVKDMGTSSFYRYGNCREQILAAMADESLPEIVYLERSMSPGQLASLYAACDCLVAPYRGEGFGLPILEAMACGVPPIVPRGGASDDFVAEAAGYLLPAEEVECRHDWRLCGTPMELSVDVGALRTAMREAYENREENRAKGQSASRAVLDRFTWAKTAQKMAERLLALADGRPCRHLAPRDRSPAAHRTDDHRPGLPARAPAVDAVGAQAVAGTVPVQSAADGTRSVPATVLPLTVCMLSHNDERTIGESLGRIRPFVREVLVLDLGSTDRSRLIALEYGARLYGGVFADDLGSLRNALLSRATSDWILCLDADELLGEPQVERIGALVPSLAADVWGVRIRVRDGGRFGPARADGHEVRLFRNRSDIVFQLRSAEEMDCSISRLGGRVTDSEIEIVCASVADRLPPCYRCRRTRLQLLHRDLADRRGDPSVLFALGKHHFRNGDFFHAECYLNDCLERSRPDEAHYQAAALGLIESHVRKGDPWRAAEVADHVLQQVPDDGPFRAAVRQLVPSEGGRP